MEEEITIGKYLKKRRTAKKISLDRISKSTKLTVTLLENLENDRFDLLPNKTYVIGYIKSYGKILKEDIPELLILFEKTYSNPQNENLENLKYFPLTEEVKSKAVSKIVISGVITLSLSIWAIIYFYNSTQTKLTELKSITPREVTADTPLKVEPEIAPPQEITVVAPEPEPEPEPVPEVKEEEEVEEKVVEEEEPKFYRIEKTLYAFKTKNVKDTINKFLPIPYQNSVVPGKQNIFINAARGDSWITYKSDDSPIKKFVLKKGRTLLIRGSLVRVFLGNVRVTEMFLNNRPLRIDSRTGVKSLVFPQEEKENYRLPLFVFKDDGSVITSEDFLTAN